MLSTALDLSPHSTRALVSLLGSIKYARDWRRRVMVCSEIFTLCSCRMRKIIVRIRKKIIPGIADVFGFAWIGLIFKIIHKRQSGSRTNIAGKGCTMSSISSYSFGVEEMSMRFRQSYDSEFAFN